MKKLLIILSIILVSVQLPAQDLRVLFLGNSYTGVNNLPQMISNLCDGDSCSLIYESNTPGGCTLLQHANDANSLNLIRQGDWDFVVLQEQSQIPTIDYYRYYQMYPGFRRLHDSIKKYNPCANLVSYLTWGRRYGGMQCDDSGNCSPNFINFGHMQDSLTSAYTEISFETNAYIAPVGEAWRIAIDSLNLVMHSGDNSHPSIEGSYLAACVFYATMWKQSPIGLPVPTSIQANVGLQLQQIARQVVLDNSTSWNLDVDLPHAAFEFTLANEVLMLQNQSSCINEMTYFWNFGDGFISTDENPTHTYTAEGTYLLQLIVKSCYLSDSYETEINIETVGLHELENEVRCQPNPFNNQLQVTNLNKTPSSVSLFDMCGRRLNPIVTNNENGFTLNTEQLVEGVYVLEVVCENHKKHFTVIKQ